MVRDTVTHLRAEGQQVFLDAEHFFDGYRANRAYALEVLRTAHEAGAEVVALCDTNGGMLPDWVADVVHDVIETTGVRVGIHCPQRHRLRGRELAGRGRRRAPRHVQGCINGYGERTGNADLVIGRRQPRAQAGPRRCCRRACSREATRIAHAVAEVTNVPPASRQPYVGVSAFAHKAGLHASAIKVDPDLYQHIDPAGVGNDMRLLVSDMAGRASIELKGRELGFDLVRRPRAASPGSPPGSRSSSSAGYTFEAADASFELLLARRSRARRPSYFDVESWRVITETSHRPARRRSPRRR